MNKRANIYLNIYGMVAFLLSLSCLGLSLTMTQMTYHLPGIMRGTSIIIGMIFGLIYIAIELFLFILLNGKFKGIELVYIMLEVIGIIYCNNWISFSGFLVLLVCKIIKDILRITLVDVIYQPKEFNRYCKMFHIKIRDFKKQKTKVSTAQEKVKVPISTSIYVKEPQIKGKRTENPI